MAVIDGIVKERSAQEWMDTWTPLGIVASPIQNLKDVSEDPQAWENDYFLKIHCDEVDREVESEIAEQAKNGEPHRMLRESAVEG